MSDPARARPPRAHVLAARDVHVHLRLRPRLAEEGRDLRGLAEVLGPRPALVVRDDHVGARHVAGVKPQVVGPSHREGEVVVLLRAPAHEEGEPARGQVVPRTAGLAAPRARVVALPGSPRRAGRPGHERRGGASSRARSAASRERVSPEPPLDLVAGPLDPPRLREDPVGVRGSGEPRIDRHPPLSSPARRDRPASPRRRPAGAPWPGASSASPSRRSSASSGKPSRSRTRWVSSWTCLRIRRRTSSRACRGAARRRRPAAGPEEEGRRVGPGRGMQRNEELNAPRGSEAGPPGRRPDPRRARTRAGPSRARSDADAPGELRSASKESAVPSSSRASAGPEAGAGVQDRARAAARPRRAAASTTRRVDPIPLALGSGIRAAARPAVPSPSVPRTSPSARSSARAPLPRGEGPGARRPSRGRPARSPAMRRRPVTRRAVQVLAEVQHELASAPGRLAPRGQGLEDLRLLAPEPVEPAGVALGVEPERGGRATRTSRRRRRPRRRAAAARGGGPRARDGSRRGGRRA